MERDVVQHGAAAIVAEADVREFNVAAYIIQQHGSIRVLIFRTLMQNLPRALKASESLGKLSANRDHLHDGRNQEAQEQRVSKDRKSTRLNSSHDQISYAVFCLKKKKTAVTICPDVLCK